MLLGTLRSSGFKKLNPYPVQLGFTLLIINHNHRYLIHRAGKGSTINRVLDRRLNKEAIDYLNERTDTETNKHTHKQKNEKIFEKNRTN